MNQDGWKRLALLAGGGIGAALAASAAIAGARDNLSGEVALVTGGSRGLGFLLAQKLAKEGCRIAICARDSGELARAKQLLEAEGAEVVAVACDVASENQVHSMVEEVKLAFGRVDILINNAGIITVGPIQNMTPKDFEDAMNVMFWGALWPTLAVLPEMLARKKGRIVNVTSVGGKIAVPHLIPYCCAKFAAVALSEGLHAELKKHKIHVTTVVPGLMRTGSHANAWFKGKQEAEYSWFSLSAVLPVFSINAERAARTIVNAIRTRTAEITLGVPAEFAARLYNLLPAISSN